MKLPKELTQVTPLSIILSGFCFVVCVILAFYFGMQYQKIQDVTEEQLTNTQSTVVTQENPLISTAQLRQISGWKTYKSIDDTFSFQYPENWYSDQNPNVQNGNSFSFFLDGTKTDHGYGDHQGNEVFSFDLHDDKRSLESLKKDFYPTATFVMVANKPALKTEFGLYLIKVSESKIMTVVTGLNDMSNQILSTFQFTK